MTEITKLARWTVLTMSVAFCANAQPSSWCAVVADIRDENGVPIPNGRMKIVERGRDIREVNFTSGIGRMCDIPESGGDIQFSAPGCLPVSIAGVRPSALVTMSLRVVLNRCTIVDSQRFEFVFSLRVPSDRSARVRVNGQLIQNAVDEFGRLFILARPFNSTPMLKLHKTGQMLVYDRTRDVLVEYEGSDGKRRTVSFDGRPTADVEQFRTIELYP